MQTIDVSESKLTERRIEFRPLDSLPIPGQTCLLALSGGAFHLAVRVDGFMGGGWVCGEVLGGGGIGSLTSVRAYGPC